MNAKNYTNVDRQFYPTPQHIADIMLAKVDFKRVRSILEPHSEKAISIY